MRFGLGGMLLVAYLNVAVAAAPSREVIESATDAAWSGIHRSTSVPGAVVAVVGPAGTILVKGYGTRNIGTGEPVNPGTTLFQIGSVTKIFTAILALQAVDAGRLTLDEDLRHRFPDLSIEDDFSQPVTLRQLLSHRAGFDGDLSGVMTTDRDAARRVSADARHRHLQRVRQPDVLPAYDNTGVGLLGELSARSLGDSFHDAIEKRIFLPLGMIHSSIGLPPGSEGVAAACHRTLADGSIALCPHTFMRVGFEGAGALASTGEDMAAFMTSLLNGGRTRTGTLLSPESFRDYMNLDLNRFAPAIPGMGWLIEETTLAGRSAYYHTGGYDGFSSGLYLFSQAGYGIFVSVEQYIDLPKYQNLSYLLDAAHRRDAFAHNNGYKAVADIATAVAALIPDSDAPAASTAGTHEPTPRLAPGEVAGFYRSARTDAAGLFDAMIASMFGLKVTALDAHSISINGDPYDWAGGSLYRSKRTGRAVAFQDSPLGMILASNSSEANLRTPGTRSASSVLVFIGLLILSVIVTGLCVPLARQRIATRICTVCFAAAAIACLCVFLELQYFAVIYYGGMSTWMVRCWRVLYLLALAAGVVATIAAVRALVRPSTDPLRARDRTALLISGGCFVALLAGSAGWDALLLPY